MDENKAIKVNNKFGGGSSFGLVWVGGWLFTIGYLKLQFWSGVLAVFVWPYFLGDYFSG